jgi:hypothetical protein
MKGSRVPTCHMKWFKGDDGPRDVERCVERIRKIVAERVRVARVNHSRALLAAYRATGLRSQFVTRETSIRANINEGSYIL